MSSYFVCALFLCRHTSTAAPVINRKILLRSIVELFARKAELGLFLTLSMKCYLIYIFQKNIKNSDEGKNKKTVFSGLIEPDCNLLYCLSSLDSKFGSYYLLLDSLILECHARIKLQKIPPGICILPI